jgi:hypothetical protein
MGSTRALAAMVLLTCGLPGCEVGEGDGSVTSDNLYVEECWQGQFDLRPDFFAASPFQETMMIRIQRGDQLEEEADGVLILINDVPRVRQEMIGQPIELSLSPSVTPPGIPIIPREPPLVSLSMYLHSTCHAQNSALYAVGGWIRFDSLFNGDPNEDSADERLTQGQFEAIVVDPRDGLLSEDTAGRPTITYPEGVQSILKGSMSFLFHRGTPAQPFP